MTEDEAKKKWCPFARMAPDGYNRNADGLIGWGGGPVRTRCVGSRCMAWRTRHQWLDNAQQEPSWVSYSPYAFEPGEGQERDDGYCGLAGELAR